MPTISPSLLTKGGLAGDATSYATASVSPAANKTILAGFVGRDSLNALNTTITCSGNGLTWTQVASPGASGRRFYVFRASSSTTPTAGAITFSNIVSSGTADGGNWFIAEVDGVDITTTDGVVQAAGGTGTTSVTCTLSSAITAGNGTVGLFASYDPEQVSTAMTPGDGYTELESQQTNLGGENVRSSFYYRTDGQTVVNATGDANVDFMRGVGMEIAAAASQVKTVNGLVKASVKTINGLPVASVKRWGGKYY